MKPGSFLLASAALTGLVAGGAAARFAVDASEGRPKVEYVHFEPMDDGVAGTGWPSDPNIQYNGRWNRSDPSYYSIDQADCYLEARFTGTSVGVQQRKTVDLYYSIDHGPLQWRRNVSGKVTLANRLSGTSHTLRIGYREMAGSAIGDAVFGGLVLAVGGQTLPDRAAGLPSDGPGSSRSTWDG